MPVPTWTSLPPLTVNLTDNSSSRHGAQVRLVVVHDPEGFYESTINWIKNPRSQVSYHVLGDEEFKKVTQLVRWSQKAWSCAGFNSVSDNISISGFAGNKWSYPALNRLARSVAFRLRKRSLPPTFQSAPVSLADRGFTFHSELGPLGGGHHDPGLTGVKKQFFIAAVKFHYKLGGFRKSWGLD
jgi:hypothetical protein